MAVSSGALGFVFPTSGGLGDERANRSAVGLGCFDHGVGAMASATRTDPSYRSGATVLEYGLCRDAEKAGHGAEHEPAANCYDNGEINRVYHCDKCVITRPGPSGYTGAMATAHFVAVTAALLAGWMPVRAKGCFNWSDPMRVGDSAAFNDLNGARRLNVWNGWNKCFSVRPSAGLGGESRIIRAK